MTRAAYFRSLGLTWSRGFPGTNTELTGLSCERQSSGGCVDSTVTMRRDGYYHELRSPLHLPTAARKIGNKRFLDHYFYLSMSLLIAGVVVYGFSHAVEKDLIKAVPPRPWIIYFYAVVFSGWVVFLILQSALIRTRHIRLHRKLGWFGAILGPTIPILGIATAISMGRFRIAHLPGTMSPSSLIISFFDMASFAIPFGFAFHWRRKPELHRRFMLIASCALTSAAFARFPQSFVSHRFHIGVDMLIGLGALRDIIVAKRVHPVYLWSLPILVTCQFLAMRIATTAYSAWLKIANAILH